MCTFGSLGTIYTTLEEFKNGGFTLKMQQMLAIHTTMGELKMQQSPVIDLCLTKLG